MVKRKLGMVGRIVTLVETTTKKFYVEAPADADPAVLEHVVRTMNENREPHVDEVCEEDRAVIRICYPTEQTMYRRSRYKLSKEEWLERFLAGARELLGEEEN